MSRWIDTDLFASPFSQAAFERRASKEDGGPLGSALAGAFFGFMAVVCVAGACSFVAIAAMQAYLDVHGSEAMATITGTSSHIEPDGSMHGRSTTPWKLITYEFTTANGDVVAGKVDRPIREMSRLPQGNRIAIHYWDRFPRANVPRDVPRNVSELLFMTPLFLFAGFYFGSFARRIVRWRRRLLSPTLL